MLKFTIMMLLAAGAYGCSNTNPLGSYCYVERDDNNDLNTYSCICPWSTCQRKSTTLPEYECVFTSLAIGLWTAGAIMGCLGICACIYCCVRSSRRRREEATHIYVAQQPVYGTPVNVNAPQQQCAPAPTQVYSAV